MSKVHRGSLWIFIFLVHLSPAVSLRCLNCLNIPDVRNCLTLKECSPNQKCYSYRFLESGRELYSLGCIDNVACSQSSDVIGKRDTLVSELAPSIHQDSGLEDDLFYERERRQDTMPCLQCCDGSDGCNNRLCSAPATNIRCMVCNDALETAQCEKLTVCGNDEFCFVQRSPHQLTLELRYQMGCMGFKQCEGLKDSFAQHCTVCCNNTDFCNYDACKNWTPPTTPSSTTVSSTTATQPSTKMSSTTTTQPSTTVLSTTTTRPSTTVSSTKTTQPSTKVSSTTTTQPSTTVSSTITTQPSTTVSSTKTSLISTTPAPQLVMKGPDNSPYLSHVELQCISLPSAQTYEWKFNNSSVLPNGVVKENEMAIQGNFVGSHKIVISKLNETNAGVYTCVADINGHTLIASHSIDILKEAPTVSISKSTVTTNFALLCNVTGYPPPHTGWAFLKANTNETSVGLPHDVIVTTGEGYTIAVATTYRPEIHDGSWYCAARNSFGNVIKGIDIP